MTDKYAEWHFYLALFGTAMSICAFIHSWWHNRDKAVKGRFAAQEQKLEVQDKEISDLKTRIAAMPNTTCHAHTGMFQRQENHTERINQHRELLTRIEGDLKHLPNVRDIEKLHERINEVRDQGADLKSEFAKISGAMPGIIHAIETMNEFLLNQGR